MFYGILAPNFGDYSDPRVLADLAGEAEEACWDCFFVVDHLLSGAHDVGGADPWISLSAIATRTNRIRIGPMVTPLARRRPWKLARETVTLDRLAAGRLTLGVGLGGRWNGSSRPSARQATCVSGPRCSTRAWTS